MTVIHTGETETKAMKEAFTRLGFFLQSIIDKDLEPNDDRTEFDSVLVRARQKNPWFTEDNTRLAFSTWADALQEDKINQWLTPYFDQLKKEHTPKTIGVINAGNIPLVGFHDLIAVLMSGNKYLGKNASDDPYLLPYIAQQLIRIEPTLKDRISFSEKLSGFDAVIATGSNNSARYFDYYFGKYPNIIRMNRNAVAVLMGNETEQDLKNLGKDIFLFFGLGCRNVSKIFVPAGYNLDQLFEALESFSNISQHNKYMNNHDYNNAVYLLKTIPFLDNGFMIVKEDEAIASPISVVYYEFYEDLTVLETKLAADKEKIQCIVFNGPPASLNTGTPVLKFGEAQFPQLWEYADGVDTMKFLLSLTD